MSIVTTVLMIACALAAIALLRKGGEAAWVKPAAVVCAVLAVVLAIGRIVSFSSGDAANEAQLAMERYQKACGEYLGESLITRHPGARVIIVAPPKLEGFEFSPIASANRALVDQLQATLEGKMASVSVHAVEIPAEVMAEFEVLAEVSEDESQMMMEEYMVMDTSMWFDGESLSKLLTELGPEADLIVCTADLSPGMDFNDLPPADQGAALVLLNSSSMGVSDALEQTCLDIAVLNRMPAGGSKRATEISLDAEEAFNQRFLLVTRENAASLAGQHPQL